MSTQLQKLTAAVLPEAGEICIFTKQMASGAVDQRFFKDLDTAEDFVAEQVAKKFETYFGCMTFLENTKNRFAKHTFGYKTIFVDIDCGPEKKYLDKDEGLLAFKRFVEARRLPKPWIVDSGNGIHCYFPFEEVVDYNSWVIVAEAFSQTAISEGFYVDRQVATDGVRVLRVPGTYNFKVISQPKPVSILEVGETVPLDRIKGCLNFIGLDLAKPAYIDEEIDEATKNLIRKGEFRFDKILQRSLKKEEAVIEIPIREERPDGTIGIKYKKEKQVVSAGCAQLAKIHNDPKRSEPEWRFALSIANFCLDRDTAIVDISKDYYKGYDERETQSKVKNLKTPQTCSYAQNRSELDPTLCLNCQWRGKIKTPISLGRHIPPATPLDNILEDVKHQNLNQKVTTTIPASYPFPWFRPKQGGVAIKTSASEESNSADVVDTDSDSILVIEQDLWAIGREEDPDAGEVLRIARLLPLEGMKEFTIPLEKLSTRSECLRILAFNGVVVDTDSKQKLIQRYLVNWNTTLQKTSEKLIATTHFGWAENYSKFIIGNREVNSSGIVTLIPSSVATKSIVPKYNTKGTLDNWKRVINTYDNPGNEVRAFILFLSMGMPLYEFFKEGSGITHLTNSASGVGKTTIQKAAASVWGHPVDTMMNENDTALAVQHRAGTLRNLPVLIDEITNMAPDKASDFAYRMAFNRGKNRMQAHTNAERENVTEWHSVTITSGNNSLHDTLVAHKAMAAGELYRVLEIVVNRDDNLTTSESGEIFRSLSENYGLAGEVLAKYYVPNKEHCVDLLFKVQKQFDAQVKRKNEERFYSMMIATAITGGLIGAELGLHNIDVSRVFKWAKRLLVSTRTSVVEKSTVDPKNILGSYLSQMVRNTLVIKRDSAKASNHQLPLGELNVRYEPDAGVVYIKVSSLTSWCSEKRITFNPLKKSLEDHKMTLDITRYNLALGTTLPASFVHVLSISADMLDIEGMFDNEEQP